MISFREFILDEVFNNPMRWLKRSTQTSTEYYFTVNNQKFMSEFVTVKGRFTPFFSYHNLEFMIDRNGYYDTNPTHLNTGQVKVLSTVIDTVRDFDNHNVREGDYLSFTAADSTSRERLYARLADRLSSSMGYEQKRYQIPQGLKFVLKKG